MGHRDLGHRVGPRSPRRMLGRAAAAAACLMFAGSTVTAGHAAGSPTAPMDGGLRRIEWQGSTIRVPAPGSGVRLTRLMTDGTERSILVVTAVDGRVSMLEALDQQAGAVEVAATRPKPACKDGTYRLDSGPWEKTYEWWFKEGTTPKGTSRTAALAAIKRAVRNITHGRNDCGRRDRIAARSAYQGTTGKVESCFESLGFGRNVVLFGSLPPGVAGQSEVCYQLGEAGLVPTMANVVFSKRERWATKRAGCRGQALLEEVGTHEFGHVFGLDHVTGRAHSRLTMTPSTYPCNSAGITLGLGDMRGLERLYPIDD